jgi:hypothetical protein
VTTTGPGNAFPTDLRERIALTLSAVADADDAGETFAAHALRSRLQYLLTVAAEHGVDVGDAVRVAAERADG